MALTGWLAESASTRIAEYSADRRPDLLLEDTLRRLFGGWREVVEAALIR